MDSTDFVDFECLVNKYIGKEGSKERAEFDKSVEDCVHAYELGETIKKTRIEQNLTQTELGERIGVKKSQISRIERGQSMSLPTISKVFRALGILSGSLDLGRAGKVALW